MVLKGSGMVSLKPVVRGDLDRLFNLTVLPDQTNFVAPNAVTLAEISYLSGGYVFAIWESEVIVGLLAMIDFREHDELFEDDDPQAAFMLRLMIGAEFQGRGIGLQATKLAIDWARTRKNSCFQTSFVPENEAAKQLYLSAGLRETGRIVEGEVEMSLSFRRV